MMVDTVVAPVLFIMYPNGWREERGVQDSRKKEG